MAEWNRGGAQGLPLTHPFGAILAAEAEVDASIDIEIGEGIGYAEFAAAVVIKVVHDAAAAEKASVVPDHCGSVHKINV